MLQAQQFESCCNIFFVAATFFLLQQQNYCCSNKIFVAATKTPSLQQNKCRCNKRDIFKKLFENVPCGTKINICHPLGQLLIFVTPGTKRTRPKNTECSFPTAAREMSRNPLNVGDREHPRKSGLFHILRFDRYILGFPQN